MLGWVLQVVGLVLMMPGFRKAKRWNPFWLYVTSVVTGFGLFLAGSFFQPTEVIIWQHRLMLVYCGLILAVALMRSRRENQRDREVVESDEATEEV